MKTILIFFGAPGSGKGTQAKILSEKNKLPTISTGELLRQEIKERTKLGQKVENIISKGEYVSDNIIANIILKRTKNKDAKNGYIFDGYPRNKKQLDNLIKNFNLGKARVFAVLVNVGDKEVKKRLGGRRVCGCGMTYHIKFNPPKKKNVCNQCGEKLHIRKDDKTSVIADRLKIYHKEVAPLLKYWDDDGRLIKVNGEQDIKKVQKDIVKELKKYKI